MSCEPAEYAHLWSQEGEYDLTDGDKVLIGCWMIRDALMAVRHAIGPSDVGPKGNVAEGVMMAADILGDKIRDAAAGIGSAILDSGMMNLTLAEPAASRPTDACAPGHVLRGIQ